MRSIRSRIGLLAAAATLSVVGSSTAPAHAAVSRREAPPRLVVEALLTPAMFPEAAELLTIESIDNSGAVYGVARSRHDARSHRLYRWTPDGPRFLVAEGGFDRTADAWRVTWSGGVLSSRVERWRTVRSSAWNPGHASALYQTHTLPDRVRRLTGAITPNGSLSTIGAIDLEGRTRHYLFHGDDSVREVAHRGFPIGVHAMRHGDTHVIIAGWTGYGLSSNPIGRLPGVRVPDAASHLPGVWLKPLDPTADFTVHSLPTGSAQCGAVTAIGVDGTLYGYVTDPYQITSGPVVGRPALWRTRGADANALWFELDVLDEHIGVFEHAIGQVGAAGHAVDERGHLDGFVWIGGAHSTIADAVPAELAPMFRSAEVLSATSNGLTLVRLSVRDGGWAILRLPETPATGWAAEGAAWRQGMHLVEHETRSHRLHIQNGRESAVGFSVFRGGSEVPILHFYVPGQSTLRHDLTWGSRTPLTIRAASGESQVLDPAPQDRESAFRIGAPIYATERPQFLIAVPDQSLESALDGCAPEQRISLLSDFLSHAPQFGDVALQLIGLLRQEGREDAARTLARAAVGDDVMRLSRPDDWIGIRDALRDLCPATHEAATQLAADPLSPDERAHHLIRFGKVMEGEGRHVAAELAYRDAAFQIAVEHGVGSVAHARYLEASSALADLYEATGRVAAARWWRGQLLVLDGIAVHLPSSVELSIEITATGSSSVGLKASVAGRPDPLAVIITATRSGASEPVNRVLGSRWAMLHMNKQFDVDRPGHRVVGNQGCGELRYRHRESGRFYSEIFIKGPGNQGVEMLLVSDSPFYRNSIVESWTNHVIRHIVWSR